jgi:hypothetical protein
LKCTSLSSCNFLYYNFLNILNIYNITDINGNSFDINENHSSTTSNISNNIKAPKIDPKFLKKPQTWSKLHPTFPPLVAQLIKPPRCLELPINAWEGIITSHYCCKHSCIFLGTCSSILIFMALSKSIKL